MHLRGFLLVLALFWRGACAEVAATAVPQSGEQATAQRAQAESLREEAERRYREQQDLCYSKFLVSDCLSAAQKAHSKSMTEARELEKGVRDFEREEHRRVIEARESERKSELDRREAEQQSQGERYRDEEQRKAAERERKLLDKARQAEEGRQRRAAEEASRSEKMANRARQDAERAAKKSAQTSGAPAN
jgi:hypothetical protein